MTFYADLHVHSKYSIATSREATLEGYYRWAGIKGIGVIATGDFTHPVWFEEIKEKLREDGNGFLVFDSPEMQDVHFCLSTEISSVFKRNERIYKVHSLVYVPTLWDAERVNKELEKRGNISSDGRPILKLSPVEILEIIKCVSDDAYLIPAHVWTPWFSIFGSKSGYNSLSSAFDGYENEIFAVETGLSSDPAMNWMWSSLDRLTLVSNSDAHSPSRIGREANIFNVPLTYYDMFKALKNKKGFLGTIEMFPEMGKYHYDGHRKCNISLSPYEAEENKNICPVCKKPLTRGVLHRVCELADRKKPEKPEYAPCFKRRIPLTALISHIEKKGESTKFVLKKYNEFIDTFGRELDILNDVPIENIESKFGEKYSVLIGKMRKEELRVIPGYDGRYGSIAE